MKYCDVYYQPGSEPVFCYRSGSTVYEEGLYGGALVSFGWNSAGYPLNVLSGYPTRIRPTDFAQPSVMHMDADGIALDYDWQFVSFEKEETSEGLCATLTLSSALKPVTVLIRTLLDGSAMFTRTVELRSSGKSPIAFSRLGLMGGALEHMTGIQALTDVRDFSKYYSIGYFADHVWGREGRFGWHDLSAETTQIDCRFGRDRYRHPALFLKNNLMGTITFMQMGFSGGCRFSVDYLPEPEKNAARLSYCAEISGYSPLLVLRPGESFVLPEVHIGTVHGDMDAAVNEMNDHIRKSVLNRPEADGSACLVGCGMGAEHDMLMDTTMRFIDQMSEMGGEVFIIDAGWQCPPASPIDWGGCNGINRPDPDRYPNDGFRKLREYCHSRGMKFGLWVEIERLGERSGIIDCHPDWRSFDKFGRQTPNFLDLTNTEAFDWALNECSRIISEYGVELFRVDYNVDSANYFLMRDTNGSGIKECLALRQFDAVYRLYSTLKKRFPTVIFENCAGGGGRTDLGQLRAFHHTWVSDWQQAPLSLSITNGMTMVLPPERVDRLFAGMGCHSYGSLDLQMRNAMLGHLSLNVINPKDAAINRDSMEFIRHSVSLYKSFIRPILPSCRIFHHTPEVNMGENGFIVQEIAAPNGAKGAVAVYSLCLSGKDGLVVFPKGIRPDLTYRVTLDNLRSAFTVRGAELMNTGLRLSVPSSLSSELILYEVCGSQH